MNRGFLILLMLFSFSELFSQDSLSFEDASLNDSSDENQTVMIRTKDVYNIAFILPIQSDRILLGDNKKVATRMPFSVREVLGFWEGAYMAFKEYTNVDTNQKFVFHIWDNFKDDSTTDNILKDLDFYNFDAVVSPFHTKRAIKVNEYCKKKGIPFFLAQNPSDVPVKNYVNSYKFHVPLNRTFYKFYNKLNSNISYKNSNYILIYDESSKSQRRLRNYMKYKSNKDKLNNIEYIAYNDSINIFSKLNMDKKNVLFISLYKTKMVNNVLSKLVNNENLDIEVLGHNLWLNNKKIKFDTFYDMMIYSDFFIENNIYKVKNIKEKYIEMTGDDVVFEVFQGYDVARYIMEIYSRFGLDFPKYIETYKYYGATSNVHMKPTYKSNGDLVFYENTSKMLLKKYGKEWLKIEY